MALLAAGQALADDACPEAGSRARHRQDAEALGASVAGAVVDPARLRERWETVLADTRACAPGDVGAEADVLADWAAASRVLGDRDVVFALEERRLVLARTHGLDAHRGDAALRQGGTLIARGEFAAARERLLEALEAFRVTGDVAQTANVHSELSRLDRRVGDYLPALRQELAALSLRRSLAPTPELWRSLLNLAVLYEQIELFDDSRRYYADALLAAERSGDPDAVADTLNGYAGFLNDFGAVDAAQALEMAERALAINVRQDNGLRVGSCQLQIGRALLNLGRLAEAAVALDAALASAEQTRSPALRAHVQFRRGELALAAGDPDAALTLVEEARREYARQGNRHRLIKVHAVLEQLYQQRGDELQALRSGREHFRLRNELLGANASGKFGELLSNFQLAEERLRNERLREANERAAERLAYERQMRTSTILLAAAIALALLMLAWRLVSTRRLYALLEEKSREIDAQRQQLAQANVELTEYSDELVARSRIDPLTGLASRSHGMQRLGDWLAGNGGGSRWAVLILDIDHFKAINDRHGHPMGDQVLVAVAAALRASLPAEAELARIGGEEFLALVPDDPAGRARELAEAICTQVRALQVELAGTRVPVSISIGLLAVADASVTSVRDALVRADRALYAAKRDGRDCVRLATET